MNAASRFSRVLPVAEIFSVERAEHLGTEAVVTVVVGDAEHTPHAHGLRAPLRRWAEIFARLSADPVSGAHFASLCFLLRDEAEANPPAPRAQGAPVVLVSVPLAHASDEVAPRNDPGSPFYRVPESPAGEPICKPSGGLL